MQRGFGKRVAEVIRVWIPQLLVEQIDKHARARRRFARAQVFVQRLRQHDGRGGVGAQMALQQRVGEGFRIVVLKQRGVMDDCIERAKARQHGGHQRAHAGFLLQVRRKMRAFHAAGLRALARGVDGICDGRMTMHRHAPALARQPQGNGTPQTARAAGNQHGAGKSGHGSDGNMKNARKPGRNRAILAGRVWQGREKSKQDCLRRGGGGQARVVQFVEDGSFDGALFVPENE